MDKIRADLTVHYGRLLSKGYKKWVCEEALQQYDELLAYVEELEGYTEFPESIPQTIERPEWLHRDAVSVAQNGGDDA